MRIAFIVPWITQGRGGTENVGQMMANSMANRGHEVFVFTFDDQRRPFSWPMDQSITLRWLQEGDNAATNSQMTVAIAECCPDVIVGLHMNRTMLRYARSAQALQVPLVISEHIDPHFPVRLGTSSSEERTAAIAGATIFHLLNDAFVETVPEAFKDRVQVVRNTVPPAQRIADAVGGRKKTLITVARLVPRKNLARLIDEFALVAKSFPDWVLRIVGDGPELSTLKERAKKSGIARQVVFEGHSDDVYGHLSRAQIFVLPSLFEGFPLGSLEAMAHGLPLIGYAACNGFNEQVQHGVNGLLARRALEAGELAENMSALMSDDAKRAAMGAASLQRYNAFYSNQVIFDQWEKMFSDAARIGAADVSIPSEALSKAQYHDWSFDRMPEKELQKRP